MSNAIASRIAAVNAELHADGWCFMHNHNQRVRASYVLKVPIGNELPLCAECCAWWRAEAASHPEDRAMQPVRVTEIRGVGA